MTQDPRCCGSGTCIIDNEGRCWCGQQWDGRQMCAAPGHASSALHPAPAPDAAKEPPALPASSAA